MNIHELKGRRKRNKSTIRRNDAVQFCRRKLHFGKAGAGFRRHRTNYGAKAMDDFNPETRIVIKNNQVIFENLTADLVDVAMSLDPTDKDLKDRVLSCSLEDNCEKVDE